jgi:predicted ribosome quality control (RQC) complex YloA/Tae2 family protein
MNNNKFSLLILTLMTTLLLSYSATAQNTTTAGNTSAQGSNKFAQTLDHVLADIKAAELRLQQKQSVIAEEQTLLSKQIFKQQQSLVSLRKKAALNRRLADEDTLSLDKLQTRLNEWQQQQKYQVNLLNRFVRQYSHSKINHSKVIFFTNSINLSIY